MISGKVAVGGLSLEFGNAQKRFEEGSARVEKLVTEQEAALGEQRSIIEELARLYLPELSPEAVAGGLASLEKEMREALDRQARHRSELQERLSELPQDIGRRELLVAEAEGAEERAARGLDQTRHAVESELQANDTHATNVAEHRAIMERRSILKTRGSRLQTVANVQRLRYEENKAFAYLVRRQYLEPGYRGGALARWLDGRLARRIDYERLIRNYRVLRTGPHAIRAEIRELTGRAEELERDIDREEAEVESRLGLVAALEAEAAAQAALVEARASLADARARHDRLAAEIRAVDANRGRPYEEAIDVHRVFLADRSIHELVNIARSTPDPKDDALVARLEEVRAKIDSIARQLAPLRKELEESATRTTTLGDLARKAATHFTSRRSYFSENLNIGSLVSSLLDGDPDAIMYRFEESHTARPVLEPSRDRPDLLGWFSELSSQFDPELGAVSFQTEEGADGDTEIVVYDQHGRVIHRRVTRRS